MLTFVGRMEVGKRILGPKEWILFTFVRRRDYMLWDLKTLRRDGVNLRQDKRGR